MDDALIERVADLIREEGVGTYTADIIARAIIPIACAAGQRDMRRDVLDAVRGERLCDPQPDTSDVAYMQALDDAERAIRALPVPE